MAAVAAAIGCNRDRAPLGDEALAFELPVLPAEPEPIVRVGVSSEGLHKLAVPEARCDQKVFVFEGGRNIDKVCPETAIERGLTIIDLGDDWAPAILREDESLGEVGEQPYLERYLRLAAHRFGKGQRWERAREDRHFELYGIPPTFTLIRERLADDERHACHDRIENKGLDQMTRTIRYETVAQSQRRLNGARWQRGYLRKVARKRGLSSLDELAKVNRWFARDVRRLRAMEAAIAGIKTVQKHLRCEGARIPKRFNGYYTWITVAAVERFQRKTMYLDDGDLGPYTRQAFQISSLEHDYRTALRVLRARVVDATGLIEDGSANEEWAKVMGRFIDSPVFRVPTGHPVPEHAAGDHISAATEAAAIALGWDSPRAVRSFFDTFAGKMAKGTKRKKLAMKVAVKLPPPPAWHSSHMDLFAEIDRGDVWYDYPGLYWGGCISRQGKHKPQLTLYTRHQGKKIALVRWHTTIGGWNKERTPGGWVGLAYKNSDVGKRLWRDLIVSPTWRPLPSTPDGELVERVWGKGWRPKYEVMGPSYRSAYGLVMLIHHWPAKTRSGRQYVWDNGIRTHGSANISSIIKGCSHGCHRLWNHHSVRLANFLLTHRHFVRRGPIRDGYERKIRYKGRQWKVKLHTRGYKYELTPPVEVNVLKGRIRGKHARPPKRIFPIRYAPGVKP